eukprot:gene19489-23883_t
MNDKDATVALPSPIPLDVFNPNNSNVPQLARQGWDAKDDTIETRYGTYLSTRLHMTEDLSLVLGGRLSWYKTDSWSGDLLSTNEQKHEFTPFAGAIYDLDDAWSLYASYADIFMPQAGYRTAHFGKWHLTNRNTHGAPAPTAYGFDEFAVFNGGAETESADLHATPENAVKFIAAKKDRPFFLN